MHMKKESSMREMNNPHFLVRVASTTYNQASYIVDAMNGFTMQKTTFPFVCTIIDDASTDGEQEVIKQYLEDFFDFEDKTIARNEETEDYRLLFARHKTNLNCYFAVLLLKYNHYSIGKLKPMVEDFADTKYIAICEGDDYWTDKHKLQLQVDEMGSHDEVDICAHTTVRMKNNMIHGYIRPIEKDGIIPIEKVISEGGGLVSTNSLLLRRNAFTSLSEFQKVMGGDHSMQIKGSLRGGMLFIDKEMSVYRVMAANSWSSRVRSDKKIATDFYAKQIRMLDVLDKETGGKYKEAISMRKLTIEFQKVCYLRNWHELKDEKYKSILEKLSFRQKVQLLLNRFAPWLVTPVSIIVDIVRTIFSKIV